MSEAFVPGNNQQKRANKKGCSSCGMGDSRAYSGERGMIKRNSAKMWYAEARDKVF